MKTTFNLQQMPYTRFGYQVMREIEDDIRAIGANNALLIIDREMKSLGLTESIEQLVSTVFNQAFTHVIEEKILSFGSIQKALNRIGRQRFDAVIGFGGWRCTDMSKVLSLALTNPFSKESVISGQQRITHHEIPLISIPTTPPNGAEIDDSVLIRDEISKQIHVFQHPYMIPRLTVIDPELMMTIPPDLTASTGLDSLSHAIDALVSVHASPFSEMYALQGFALLRENLVTAFRQPDNIKARYNVALGSLYAALALNMTGSGVVHAMSYPLSARYDISHPQASALMLPYVMKYNLPVVPQIMLRVARYFGKTVGDSDAEAEKAVEALLEMYKILDHPVNLSAYNVPRIDMDLLVDSVVSNEMFLKRNPRVIDAGSIRMIYESAL